MCTLWKHEPRAWGKDAPSGLVSLVGSRWGVAEVMCHRTEHGDSLYRNRALVFSQSVSSPAENPKWVT